MRWIVGAILGALSGTIVWSAIAYFLRAEFGWIAWVIGAYVGWCAWRFVDGDKSRVRGLVCAAIAIAAIVGGKSMSAVLEVQHRATIAGGELTDAEARAFFARSVHLDNNTISEEAQAEADQTARQVWAAWSAADRLTYKEQIAVHVRADAAAGGFPLVLSTFFDGLDFFDLVWSGLAYASAFTLSARARKAPKKPEKKRKDEEDEEPVQRFQTKKWAA